MQAFVTWLEVTTLIVLLATSVSWFLKLHSEVNS